MTTKQYLMQARNSTERVNQKMTSMGRLCKEAQSPACEREDLLPGLGELQADVCREIRSLVRQHQELTALIAQLPDSNHRGVLTLRYVYGLKWEQVARRMHYSSRHLHRLHQQALEELARCREKALWRI